MRPAAPRPAPEAAPLGAAPWVGADAGPACPLCLRALKGTPLAEHLAAAGHSSHDAACERCHKHFSTYEALTEHLYGACGSRSGPISKGLRRGIALRCRRALRRRALCSRAGAPRLHARRFQSQPQLRAGVRGARLPLLPRFFRRRRCARRARLRARAHLGAHATRKIRARSASCRAPLTRHAPCRLSRRAASGCCGAFRAAGGRVARRCGAGLRDGGSAVRRRAAPRRRRERVRG